MAEPWVAPVPPLTVALEVAVPVAPSPVAIADAEALALPPAARRPPHPCRPLQPRPPRLLRWPGQKVGPTRAPPPPPLQLRRFRRHRHRQCWLRSTTRPEWRWCYH